MSNHNIVTSRHVMLTFEKGKLSIEGPGWRLGANDAKSARLNPRNPVYVDVRDDDREVYVAQGIPYTYFRLNENFGSFGNSNEVIDYINNVEEAPSTFSRSVAAQSGSFSATLGQIAVVDNTAAPVTVTLPTVTSEDVGQDILLYCKESPQNRPVTIVAADTTQTINGIAASGAEVARSVYNLSNKDYEIIRVTVIAENQFICVAADSTYAALVFAALGDDILPTSGQQNGAINLPNDSALVSTGDWFIGMKFESSPGIGYVENFSLISNGNAAIGWWAGSGRTHGATILTAQNQSTFGGIETTTHAPLEQWVLLSYDSGNNELSMWSNGTKVVDAQSVAGLQGGVGTGVAIGGSPGLGEMSAVAPIPGMSISSVMYSTGSFLTDDDVAEFTPTRLRVTELPNALQAKVEKAIIFDALGGVMDKGSGSVSVGSLVSFEEVALGAG